MNKSRFILKVCGFLLAAVPSVGAAGDCGLHIGPMLPLFLNLSNPLQSSVLISRQGQKSCKYFVTFGRGHSANFERYLLRGSQQYRYNLYKDGNLQTVLKDLPSADQTEVIEGQFTGNSDLFEIHAFTALREETEVKPPGLYSDTVRVSVYEGNFRGNPDLADSRNLLVFFLVPQEVKLSLVDSGAPFNPQDVTQSLEFGALQTGKSLGFDLIVQSNAGYVLSMSSQNNGSLKHAQHANQKVGYSLAVGGVTKDLSASESAPVTVATGSGATPEEGQRHSVRVTIGSVDHKMSGQYQDNVTVTVTATD